MQAPLLRPEALFPLFADLSGLKGIGPRYKKLYARLAGEKVIDLCWHLPCALVDRSYSPTLQEARADCVATLVITVTGHLPPSNRRSPYRVICQQDAPNGTPDNGTPDNGTGGHGMEIELTFFHVKGDYLDQILPIGERRAISGKIERFGHRWQMTHPDHVVPVSQLEEIKRVEPVYPLTAGVTNRPLSKAVQQALDKAPDLPEWQDRALLERRGWPSWRRALHGAHNPESKEDLHPLSLARQRLAYDELLANQLALSLIRRVQSQRKGRITAGSGGGLRDKALKRLPFALTPCQQKAIAEIVQDMARPQQMLRLLQGDVGSGKTAVALMAMLAAIEYGQGEVGKPPTGQAGGVTQAAMVAPTEILARQHYESLAPLVTSLGLKVVLLTGRHKGKSRQAILEDISAGGAQMIIGTHAIFQEDVAYANLTLAVVDEQHRFGVHQRLALGDKGQGPVSAGEDSALRRDNKINRAVDMLVMTATPIPRTLMLTSYGDMEVSRLTEKPAGRKPVDTRTLRADRLAEVIARLSRALAGGARVYWVCPLVEGSEKLDLAAAEDRYHELQGHFGERVGLVHGQMRARDKDRVMEDFAQGKIDLLVATTVIEVGVNVPEATVMIIEHAERFGLAQLHQLRGRIGRGGEKSTCLLLYHAPLSDSARERLKIMRESDDGFVIAEKDLELRGFGEVLGTKQSGMASFRLADLSFHHGLLPLVRDDVALIMDKDPGLKSARGRALRTLLYLFERDSTVSYLQSG